MLILAALARWASAAGREQKPRLAIGEFHAVRMVKPPVIDGKIEPGEWDGALTTSGLITPFDHTLQEAETTVAMGFDDRNFYFLFNCPRGNREWRLAKTARQNDDYSFGDSGVEVWITPPTKVPETYQNVINTFPAVLDMKMIPSRGYTAQGWKGHWTLGVTEDDARYVIEAAIPITDFGFDTVRGGDVWRFLLCRNSPGTRSRSQASWSVTQGFAEIPQHPKVHLDDDQAVLQLLGVASVFTGRYDFPMAVVAPRKGGAVVDVELRFQKDVLPAGDDRIEKKTFSLKPGQRQEFHFTGDVTEMKKGFFSLAATTREGTRIFQQSFPFEVSGFVPRKPQRPQDVPPPQELDLRTMYGPQTNTLLVKADIIDMPDHRRAASAEVKVTDPRTGKVVKQQAMSPFVNWYSDASMSLESLPIPVQDAEPINKVRAENAPAEAENAARKKAGRADLVPLKPLPETTPLKMLVQVTVKDKDGKELKTSSQEVALRRYKFPWQDNDVGISDRVIPPWTPVTVSDGTVGVWNRKLHIDGLGLAGKIDNGGVDQIASMRLVAVRDGKDVPIQAGKPTVARQTEAAIDLKGAGSGAGLKLQADTRVEFDGFVLINLTVAPESAPAKVDKLYLEVVLPESEATHFCTTAGGWSAVHDVTPAYWSSQSTSSGMLVGDFVPYVWLTNSDRAFLWFADSDKGWITDPDGNLPTQQIVRKDGRATLRVHFIEVPSELSAPLKLTYGYQAFPSRPLPPGWRSIICANSRAGLPSARNTYFWFDGDWAVLWPYYCSPYPWSMGKSKELFDRQKDPLHRPCVGSIAHSIGRYRDYEGNFFPELAVDWGATPGVIGNSDVTNSKGPDDFRLYHYQRWVREANFRGLYVDENYLGLEENFLTGNAYLRPDHRLQRAYSYLGLREYFKRMKVMFHQNNVPAPNLWQHVTGGAAYNAWFGDVFFEGENVEPTDLEFDYIEVLPAGRMRSIGSSVCAGGAMTMMCQSQRHPTVHEPKHTHQFVGWVMAHDIIPEQVPLYDMIAQEARLYEADVQFLPYWKPGPISTRTPDCVVSAHKVGKRVLAWVVNTSRKDRQVAVDVDFAKLGLDRTRTAALDAETGRSVPLGEAGFTVPVANRDFVAVHLVQANPPAKAGPRSVAGPHPGEGWREFDLSWKNGKAVLKIDGQATDALEVTGFNIGRGFGRGASRFVFLAEAIDELRCFRKAE
jgi:hypothetical protein